MSTREEDLARCNRCGRERRVHRGKRRQPAEFCRDCSPNYARATAPCPTCATLIVKGAPMWQHRRKHHGGTR